MALLRFCIGSHFLPVPSSYKNLKDIKFSLFPSVTVISIDFHYFVFTLLPFSPAQITNYYKKWTKTAQVTLPFKHSPNGNSASTPSTNPTSVSAWSTLPSPWNSTSPNKRWTKSSLICCWLHNNTSQYSYNPRSFCPSWRYSTTLTQTSTVVASSSCMNWFLSSRRMIVSTRSTIAWTSGSSKTEYLKAW